MADYKLTRISYQKAFLIKEWDSFYGWKGKLINIMQALTFKQVFSQRKMFALSLIEFIIIWIVAYS